MHDVRKKLRFDWIGPRSEVRGQPDDSFRVEERCSHKTTARRVNVRVIDHME